jgi:hypothetical protein
VAGAVDLLPEVQPDDRPDEARATGTDDATAGRVCATFALQGFPDGSQVSAGDRDKQGRGPAKKCANPGKTGV